MKFIFIVCTLKHQKTRRKIKHFFLFILSPYRKQNSTQPVSVQLMVVWLKSNLQPVIHSLSCKVSAEREPSLCTLFWQLSSSLLTAYIWTSKLDLFASNFIFLLTQNIFQTKTLFFTKKKSLVLKYNKIISKTVFITNPTPVFRGRQRYFCFLLSFSSSISYLILLNLETELV